MVEPQRIDHSGRAVPAVTIADPVLTNADILAARPPKHRVDFQRPYAYLVEQECSSERRAEDVATVFLTNRECPWRCLMCDLWKNTTDHRIPRGAISRQIRFALERLPPTRHVKLFNSGSFFDRQAIPPGEDVEIARLVRGFQTVIVESHPRLCNRRVIEFQHRLSGDLEVALGLETVQPQLLARLNKGMSLDDFSRAVGFLRHHGIRCRAFVLLRPPYLDEQQGVAWALRSLQFAFELGVDCCSVIPTRPGNGILDELARQGKFAPPGVASMEDVLERGLEMRAGRVFVDLWDFEQFVSCHSCGSRRRERLEQMNLTQQHLPPIACQACRERSCEKPSGSDE